MKRIKRLEDIPEFGTESEEAAWWDTHGFSDELLAQMRPAREVAPRLRPPRASGRPRTGQYSGTYEVLGDIELSPEENAEANRQFEQADSEHSAPVNARMAEESERQAEQDQRVFDLIDARVMFAWDQAIAESARWPLGGTYRIGASMGRLLEDEQLVEINSEVVNCPTCGKPGYQAGTS